MSQILDQLERNEMQSFLHLKKCVLVCREDRLVKDYVSVCLLKEHGIRDQSCDVAWQGIPVCDADGISDGVITAHTDPWRVCQLLHQPVIASCYTPAHRPMHLYHSQKLTRAQGKKKTLKVTKTIQIYSRYIYFLNHLLSVIFIHVIISVAVRCKK